MMLYTDPGTGMLVLQVLMSGVFGAMFYFRKTIARFTLWRRARTKQDATS
jgi:hypothetical protein